jgi:hypothetical protein
MIDSPERTRKTMRSVPLSEAKIPDGSLFIKSGSYQAKQ